MEISPQRKYLLSPDSPIMSSDSAPFWGSHAVKDSGLELFAGDVQIACKLEANEFWVQWKYGSEKYGSEKYNSEKYNSENLSSLSPDSENESSKLELEKWSRYVANYSSRELVVSPCLPDKGVVVKPEQDFYLTANGSARIYVRVPIWIRCQYGSHDLAPQVDIPTNILSLTWFGEFDRGELCYWMTSSGTRSFNPEDSRLHLAVCPLQINNSSDETLLISKLRLKVETLSLFLDGNHIWGSETSVTYRGTSGVSKVDVLNGPPQDARNAMQVAPARRNIRRSMSLLTFGRMWNIGRGYDL